MKRLLLQALFLITFQKSLAQEYKLDTLVFNGLPEDRINYVILGDGYLASQITKFQDDAQTLTEEVFNQTPYKEYANYFNVFTISVPSNEEGAANDPENLIDNYFGSTFNYDGTERALVATNVSRVTEVLVNHFPSYDQVFMLVNSSKYGGTGGWVATASTHFQSTEIALHELGHSFAGLADEYWPDLKWVWETYNMTQESSPELIRWKNWLGDKNIGILSHRGNSSWKKPSNSCKMEFLGRPFCAVCREQFIRVIHELTSIIDDYSPKSVSSVDDLIGFEIVPVTPNPNTLVTSWFLNDQEIAVNENSVEINKTDLNEGNNVLMVNVYDITAYDRRSTYYVSSVTWNINNEVISTFSKTEKERENEEFITSVETVTKAKLSIDVFPNPTSNILTIRYLLDQPSDIHLSMLSESGQLISRVSKKSSMGEQQHEIDISTYDQGVYFLKLQSNAFDQTIKVIKQN